MRRRVRRITGARLLDGSKDDKTTGILVFSGGTRVTLRIAFNHIFDNKIGIWLSKAVAASGLGTNRFTHVPTPILAGQ